MIAADFSSLVSLALGLWASGFGLGLILTTFRKYADKL